MNMTRATTFTPRTRSCRPAALPLLSILAATMLAPAAFASAPTAGVKPTHTPGSDTSSVQSLLLRAVAVNFDVERSLLSCRDILGQEVVEDVPLWAEGARAWLGIPRKPRCVS